MGFICSLDVRRMRTIFLFFSISFSVGCPEFFWKPISYKIQIDTDIFKNESTFRGEVVIFGVTTAKTDKLVLHSGVNLSQVLFSFNGQSFEPSISENETVLTLMLNQTLNRGENFDINFKYYVSKKPVRLNLEYNEGNGTLRPVFATDFEPSEARNVFPCLDIPQYKAYFDLKLARPENMTALSNMPLKSTSLPDPQVGNQVWDTFYTSKHPMSTYLFAFVIFDQYKNITIDDKITIWHHQNTPLSFFKLTIKAIPEIFKFYEEFTSIKYDFPKFDLFFVPEREHGAMENWGLVLFSNKVFTDIYDKVDLIEYLAHEIGHQWFGNMVTCKYWCYLWINEGLDTYMTHLVVNKLLPSASFIEGLIAKKYNHWEAMTTDYFAPNVLTNHTECCEHFTEWFTNEKIAPSYSKGSLLFHMVVNHIMDEDSFKKGVRKYLKENAYSNVTGYELWKAFEEYIPITLPISFPDIMKTWTDNKGYPILNVHRFKNGSIAVQQVSSSNQTVEFWWIPLTYTTSKKKDFNDLKVKIWLKPNGMMQHLDVKIEEDEWILFNIQSAGYYEVNYDEKSWRLLAQNLIRSHSEIHHYNRAELVIEASQFLSEKFRNVLFDIYSYLKDEDEYLPLMYGLEKIEDFLSKESDRHYFSKLHEFYCRIVHQRYNYIHSRHFQMNDLSRRKYADFILEKDCTEEVDRDVLKPIVNSILNNQNAVELVSPTTFWCRAMLSSDDQRIVDFVKQKYVEDPNYLSSLCCAQKQKHAIKALKDIVRNLWFNGSGFDETKFFLVFKSCLPFEMKNCFFVDIITENYENLNLYKDFKKLNLSIIRRNEPYPCIQKFNKWMEENKFDLYDSKYHEEDDDVMNNWLKNNEMMFKENFIGAKDVPNTSLYFKLSDQEFLKIV